MTAEQILDIVLRGREQEVDAGLVHQAIEPIAIERDGRCAWRCFAEVEHERLLGFVRRETTGPPPGQGEDRLSAPDLASPRSARGIGDPRDRSPPQVAPSSRPVWCPKENFVPTGNEMPHCTLLQSR